MPEVTPATHYLQPIALICAAIAAAILLAYLVRRPALSSATKVWLLFGIGVFPIAAAMTGNVAGYEVTKERKFCGSCHQMHPYTNDAADPKSNSLAALHSRNTGFGAESCYSCHRDYRKFGTATTKINGLRHLYAYYRERGEEASQPIQLYEPYPNDNCMHCHSTTLPGWLGEAQHEAMVEEIRSGEISCATEGCHGPVHTKAEGGETP